MASYHFSAAAARENAKRARAIDGTYKQKETAVILNEIEAISKLGKTSTYFYEKMVDRIIEERLNQLGYKTKIHSDQHDGASMLVDWS